MVEAQLKALLMMAQAPLLEVRVKPLAGRLKRGVSEKG